MQVPQWNLGLGKQSSRSSAYGAFTGYNWQWDDVVVGLEASYMHGKFGGASTASKELVSGAALSDSFFHDVRVDSSASIAISDMATFRARAAYAWGCFLPYAFGGFALGKADISRSVTVHDAVSPIISGPFTPLASLNATDAVHNHLVYGYTGGLGVDVNLSGGLFMRAEWEYVRFTSTVDTSINTVRAGLGTSSDGAGSRTTRIPILLTEASAPVGLSLSRRGRPAMKIYGDSNSGNCLKVKWVVRQARAALRLGCDRHAQGREPHHGIP